MGARPAVTAPAFRNGSEARSGGRRLQALDDGVARIREPNPTKPSAADEFVRNVDRSKDVWVEDATGPPNGG